MSTNKERAIIDAINLDELSEARHMINDNLMDRISKRLDEIKTNIRILEDTDIEEEDTEYQKFFRKALKKFGVKDPSEFESDEEKKEFFNYVDKEYKSDVEKSTGKDDPDADDEEEVARKKSK
tara:strand:- start:1668 stop:2036 length:369 start_codon:yes stop_codon:yes gene_type:complete